MYEFLSKSWEEILSDDNLRLSVSTPLRLISTRGKELGTCANPESDILVFYDRYEEHKPYLMIEALPLDVTNIPIVFNVPAGWSWHVDTIESPNTSYVIIVESERLVRSVEGSSD